MGRGATCGLQLASPHVSRQQCEFSWQGDQLVLENLGTVNVTYLNDRPIERVYVQDGDLVTFCDVALRVRLPKEAAVQDAGERTRVHPNPPPRPPISAGASPDVRNATMPMPAAKKPPSAAQLGGAARPPRPAPGVPGPPPKRPGPAPGVPGPPPGRPPGPPPGRSTDQRWSPQASTINATISVFL